MGGGGGHHKAGRGWRHIAGRGRASAPNAPPMRTPLHIFGTSLKTKDVTYMPERIPFSGMNGQQSSRQLRSKSHSRDKYMCMICMHNKSNRMYITGVCINK